MTLPRRIRWAAVLVAVVLAGIQFVPTERTNPEVISAVVAPPEVHDLLVRACFDCHSHLTNRPWYGYVAPVSWWVAVHVRAGRADLNFSEWPVFDVEERELILRDIENQLVKGEMPPGYYEFFHPKARLTDEEFARLLAWSRER